MIDQGDASSASSSSALAYKSVLISRPTAARESLQALLELDPLANEQSLITDDELRAAGASDLIGQAASSSSSSSFKSPMRMIPKPQAMDDEDEDGDEEDDDDEDGDEDDEEQDEDEYGDEDDEDMMSAATAASSGKGKGKVRNWSLLSSLSFHVAILSTIIDLFCFIFL